MSDMGQTYGNNFFRIAKYYVNTYLLLKSRKLKEALDEAERGIQFGIGKADFGIRVFYLYYLKARIQIMMDDLIGAQESLIRADKIKSEVNVVPAHWGQFVISKLVLDMYQLENAILKNNKPEIKIHTINTLKSGKEALRVAKKSANIKTEVLKLIGIYFWTIGKQNKSFEWWQKAILEGQRLNDRLELSRTHFEAGKRLLEQRNARFLGLTAENHLEKARVIFKDMDMQWDLEELENIKKV
jgi:hypothetical protein